MTRNLLDKMVLLIAVIIVLTLISESYANTAISINKGALRKLEYDPSGFSTPILTHFCPAKTLKIIQKLDMININKNIYNPLLRGSGLVVASQ